MKINKPDRVQIIAIINFILLLILFVIQINNHQRIDNLMEENRVKEIREDNIDRYDFLCKWDCEDSIGMENHEDYNECIRFCNNQTQILKENLLFGANHSIRGINEYVK